VCGARHSDYAGAAVLDLPQHRPEPVTVRLTPTGVGATAPQVGDLVLNYPCLASHGVGIPDREDGNERLAGF
jgi:hypothetical protein